MGPADRALLEPLTGAENRIGRCEVVLLTMPIARRFDGHQRVEQQIRHVAAACGVDRIMAQPICT